MTKTVEFRAFKGLRNDVPLERFAPEDLSAADDVELDETGALRSRYGATRIDTHAAHSLWADDRAAYVVSNGNLCAFDGTTATPILPMTERVCYCRCGDEVFWFSPSQCGALRGLENRSLGFSVPSGLDVTQTTGDIPAGDYLVTMTWGDHEGRESGAHALLSVHLDNPAGLHFQMPVSSDARIAHKYLYLSARNGSIPLLVGVYDSAVASTTFTSDPARYAAVRTLNMTPPSKATQAVVHNGRLFVALGNFILYSQPFELELFDLAAGFIPFDSPVRTMAPVTDGIYVGTGTETVFLSGTDPTEFSRVKLADYGTVAGTVQEVPPHYFGAGDSGSRAMLWMSVRGACAGLPGGVFKNLTADRYVMPEGVSNGAAIFKVRGGTPHFVASLFA